jgi:hypothetical protein
MFSYAEMTTRNIGFVTDAEQIKLRDATVFVCGTGGMGGAAIMALVRAGVGNLILADIDEFEVSNINRQLFCNLNTVDQHKAEATKIQCLALNPDMGIDVFHADWTDHVDDLVARADVVINGTDDLGASLLLYRTARAKNRTVIDAYASPLPSVYVTKPADQMPEERLGYPTIGTAWNALSDDQRAQSFLREAEHVILNSSSRHYVDLDLAGEVAAGKRSRMSFAPMVISTGMLMAYETFAILLNKPTATDARGWFFNPYRGRVERPKPALIAAILRPIVSRFLQKMMAG